MKVFLEDGFNGKSLQTLNVEQGTILNLFKRNFVW